MKSAPKPPDEYVAFANILRRVLKVSKTELDQRIEAAKQARKQKRKSREISASRVSGDKQVSDKD